MIFYFLKKNFFFFLFDAIIEFLILIDFNPSFLLIFATVYGTSCDEVVTPIILFFFENFKTSLRALLEFLVVEIIFSSAYLKAGAFDYANNIKTHFFASR